LLIFLAFCVGWAVIGIYGFANGDPRILIYPSDSDGIICGKEDFVDKPNLFFFDITKCLRASAAFGCPTKQVCVEKCPDTNHSPFLESKSDFIDDDIIKKYLEPYCDSAKYDSNMELKDLMRLQICPEWFVQSQPFFGRCVPFLPNNTSSDIFDDGWADNQDGPLTLEKLGKFVAKLLDSLNARSYGEKILYDLQESWYYILIGIFAGAFISFIWIIMMRFVAAVMVWASIILSILLLVVACIYSGYRFAKIYSGTQSLGNIEFSTNINYYEDQAWTWMFFLIVGAVVLLIVLILVCWLSSRIKIAIELIEEAAIAVGDMMSTLFFPILPFVLEVIFVSWFIIVGLFLASSSVKSYRVDYDDNNGQDPCKLNATYEIKDGQDCEYDEDENGIIQCENERNASCIFYKYGPTREATYFQVYNLFGFFWGLFFLEALDQMVLAGAFASWYWTLDKSKIPSAPLTASFYRTFRYHLGTLAFGSLIIAIIRMIRVMIEYIEEKLKEYHQDNPLVKCMLCFCKCCFYCLEKFMKFLNRNAYIMVAVYGKNFCWSAKEAFKLLFRNMARVFVLDKVTDFLLMLGKLVIVGGIACMSFYFFSGRIDVLDDTNAIPKLNYYFVPIIIITLVTYFIADVFFGVYEMGVDTLFLCFLEDIERNDGSQEKPYFMSKDLKKILKKMDSKPASPSKSSE